ncbi:SGNH/GDSL hydrolase family protein [Sphingomonas sp. OK281]|uniref:SGNH/GDSL hydrolase family protein n=1 Tax=Sphingomonas sp. OK281 TaxID=1881067 RepID=UPI0008EF2478|nr:SGNH/GDSL hydrolase family protein [Sphingomonas sp. OK281]SFO48122.1 Lysophospholipase L1 [Sphingomonas sp. OK281]
MKILTAILALLAIAEIPEQRWIAAFEAPPVSGIPADFDRAVRRYENQTVRQPIRLEVAASRLRVVLSNDLGNAPVRIADVRIAISDAQGRLAAGSDRSLSFRGKRTTIIPARRELTSDAIDFPVERFGHVSVTIFYPEATRVSGHLSRLFLSPPGDHGSDAVIAEGHRSLGAGIISRIEVMAPVDRMVLIAMGDSITDGVGSTPFGDLSWPQQLGRRLAATPAYAQWSVVNAGIGGNRLLHDGEMDGPAGLNRFERDVLAIRGARAIILLQGVNDIGFGAQQAFRLEAVKPAEIISAYRRLIKRAHAKGLKIYGATITPFEGADYYSREGEMARQAVNQFIRRGHAFDGILDMDLAVRTPENPQRLLSKFDSGDHLHPNDSGYQAMAEVAEHVLNSAVLQQ